jgi:hypothetical protein
MKVITATIQPFMLNKLSSALEAIEGFPGMTVMEARRFRRGRNLTERRALRIGESGPRSLLHFRNQREAEGNYVISFGLQPHGQGTEANRNEPH